MSFKTAMPDKTAVQC